MGDRQEVLWDRGRSLWVPWGVVRWFCGAPMGVPMGYPCGSPVGIPHGPPPGGPPWGFPRGSPGTLIDFKHSSLSGGIIWFEPSFLDRINLFEPSFLGRRKQFYLTSELLSP